MKRKHEQSIDTIATTIDQLTSADKYGIRSIRQLQVFLLHAANHGKSVYQVTGLSSESDQHKQHLALVRRLMVGEPYRGLNGIRLLRYGVPSEHPDTKRERPVYLTARGKKLAGLFGIPA